MPKINQYCKQLENFVTKKYHLNQLASDLFNLPNTFKTRRMNILITGANGYIGQRLIPLLLEQGHHLHCCVRNRRRFEEEHTHRQITIHEIDFLAPPPNDLPADIDVAFFLIHSMSTTGDFSEKEALSAQNFARLLAPTRCQQIVYLSGIVNEIELSKHLASRLQVEKILSASKIPLTTLRAGIIVGSGSASFEIIRDLVEKLPIMVAPKWLNTLCQPIGVRNVVQILSKIMLRSETFNQTYDIGGPEILSYRQMLMQFAAVRKLWRRIYTFPIMTPRLSSYWLYFITSTSYPLAVNLVNSMKINVVCRPNDLAERLGVRLLTYRESVEIAFERIEKDTVISSWKDAFAASGASENWMGKVEVPTFGCYTDLKTRAITELDFQMVCDNIWRIGGNQGWYYGDWLWKTRGVLDKFVGGVGLRRGRRSTTELHTGDALDFWRVIFSDRENGRLLLFAEMKVPGEAWLEFKFVEKQNQVFLSQTATFRPWGLWGRLYWYSVLPFHYFIFNGMIDGLVRPRADKIT
jgi:uncharacterized protein YbjT (DUF2867 family)